MIGSGRIGARRAVLILGTAGFLAGSAGAALAMDCTAERTISCRKSACTVASVQDDPLHISFDKTRGTISVSFGEGRQSGTVRVVETKRAMALAAVLGPPRQGGRSLSGERDVLSVRIDKRSKAFVADRGGEFVAGTCE